MPLVGGVGVAVGFALAGSSGIAGDCGGCCSCFTLQRHVRRDEIDNYFESAHRSTSVGVRPVERWRFAARAARVRASSHAFAGYQPCWLERIAGPDALHNPFTAEFAKRRP